VVGPEYTSTKNKNRKENPTAQGDVINNVDFPVEEKLPLTTEQSILGTLVLF
jgi:hypothetical protein